MWWRSILTWVSNYIDQCHGNITFSVWLTIKAIKLLFTKRTLYKCNGYVKEVAYNTLVRPLLEYASITYLIESIERIQHRASRWVIGDYRIMSSITAMLSELA